MFAAFLHPNSDSGTISSATTVLKITPGRTRNTLGWMSLDRYSRTLPPPSPSDDLRPPTSYRRRGVAEGPTAPSGQPLVLAVCRRSILTWHQVSVGEEEGGAGQEWQACPSSSPGRGAILDILSSNYFHRQSSPVGGLWSAVLFLSLRRRPLTILGRPLPTAAAGSQRGEPRSDAFGTGACVAGSISFMASPAALSWVTVSTRRLVTVNPNLAPSVGLGKRKVGQGGSGKPPPLAGQLLQVGSLWRKESSCTGVVHQMLLPAMLRVKSERSQIPVTTLATSNNRIIRFRFIAQKRAPMVICRYDILTMIAHRCTLDGVLTGPCTVTGHLWGIEYLALDKLLKVISGFRKGDIAIVRRI
ncbi:hypothetical protein EDB83DRAFT_2314920 [Lactarius deliciosus]|nr:hypothetical protein EDB83DRAFT_2314920 [Lactarius deliciosus]